MPQRSAYINIRNAKKATITNSEGSDHASCRALAALDDSALSDIGISRAAAQNEAQRPFWDAPDNWRI